MTKLTSYNKKQERVAMTTVADKVLGENEDESEGRTQAFKTELI